MPRGGRAGRISAVLVHHSGEDDLRCCVASLRAQELDDLEIVVVDNGSEDGVPARLGSGVRRLRLPRRAQPPSVLTAVGGVSYT